MDVAVTSSNAAFCYLLSSARRTYVGATTDLVRRQRQHNGALAGGARATRSGRPWALRAHCEGFRCWREALRFEHLWKRKGRRVLRGLGPRLVRLRELCATPEFSHVVYTDHAALPCKEPGAP